MQHQDLFTDNMTTHDYYDSRLNLNKRNSSSCSQNEFPFFVINGNLIIALGSGCLLTSKTLSAMRIANTNEKTINAKQQLDNLRKYMGFNISELARILRVKRPTIYEWLAYKSPNPQNQTRLDFIYVLCQKWIEKGAGRIGRCLYRKVTQDNRCLMDLLEDKTINETQVNDTLDMIAESFLKTISEHTEREELLKSEGFEPISKEKQRSALMKLTRKLN